MSGPWNNWYHCIGTLKYAWLRGDSRGWRGRHHREHCEGDYKNPPPAEMYEAQRRRSMNLAAAVDAKPRTLNALSQRVEVCRLLAGALKHYDAEFVDLAVGVKHYHVMVRFTPLTSAGGAGGASGSSVPPTGVGGLCAAHHFKDGRDPVPRHVLGKCHSWCAREFRRWMLEQTGEAIALGGLFAARPKCIPIEDRSHQLRTTRYIFDHVNEGAAVHSILVRRGEISAA